MTRVYNYSFAHKAKLAARKAVRDKEKEIKRLRKNLENKTTRLKVKKEALTIVQKGEQTNETKSKKGLVMEEGQYNVYLNQLKNSLKRKKKE